MEIHESLIDLVGDTPLVRIRRIANGLPATVLAKIEFLNPGGSVKDRIALRMVEAAEASGALRPGGTIVEPTSGNTGVGLALVAQAKGYACVFVCPDKVSEERRNVLRAYGAEVVVCPAAVPVDHPDSYHQVSDRLSRQIPRAWKPNQYANENNPLSHYASTGPEIWRQTGGRVSHFVAGVGTGGTITGTGRFLKQASGGRVRVIGADPEGSLYTSEQPRPYLVEAVGGNFMPPSYDPTVPDEVLAVPDHDAFHMTRRLAREEGLLVGGSSGLAVVAALRVAARLGPDDVVVVLLPDSGRGYLSKIFNDEWMIRHGFLTAAGDGPRVVDVLAQRVPSRPPLVFTRPNEPVRTAIATMRRHQLSQLPVVKSSPPLRAAEVIGTVTAEALLGAPDSAGADVDDPVAEHLSPPLPMVGIGSTVRGALADVGSAPAALVLDQGRPCAVVTRSDLLGFLAGRKVAPAIAADHPVQQALGAPSGFAPTTSE